MRKSILLTGAIAVVAVTLAIALTQTDTGKGWFSVYSKPRETTQDMIASAVVSPTPETVAAENAPAGPAEMTIEPMTTAAGAEATTPAETPAQETAMTPVNLDAVQAKLNAETPAAGDEKSADTAATPAEPAVAETKTTFKPDVAAALQDVSIGSANAPLVVYDFSSLSCPHCAHFHNEILPKIKADYIDKGKVRWVFHGFPLNEPALKGEMVARCAPKDQYIKLQDLMYQNQERWAFADNPIPNLSMLLKLAGITDDMFLGCVNDKDLQAALLKKIQEEGDKYKIEATPSFVINDGEKVISGAGSYEGFAFDLDALLKAKEAAAANSKK